MDAAQLERLISWFDRFAASFQGATPEEQRNYDLKIQHTRLVTDNMARLTAALQLCAEERTLAAAVAVCHDVGRFPQYFTYKTFNDATSVNHAALAVQTLRQEGVLEVLAENERSLLLKAVALHNVFTLPDDLDPQLRRLAMLIRDADKLDIWRVLAAYYSAAPEERATAVTWELPDTGCCSLPALEAVTSGRMLQRSLLATADDFKLLQLSWVFDLNFDESFRLLVEQGYIAVLAGLLPDQHGCREAVAVVTDHLRGRSAFMQSDAGRSV